ncbi:MAG: Txe/YoeB family addiction module toxin [Oscillibacter sp.]|nr:Txe/YoeB family addiction module toxin [Oscillibacter sp.]MBQ9616977.1 Txe/YoeB family addiction module toxin [Oscillibacter sp.]
MNELLFSSEGWRDYLYWQAQDRKTLKRINALLASIQRDGPANGLGKPEALRHEPGWSRRINEKDRILYHLVESGDIRITSLRGHYED